MKNLVTIQKLVLLVISVVSLAACSKKDGETAIGRDATTMSPTVAWARSVGITNNGVVFAAASQQSLFQDGVDGYVDAQFAPGVLGFVSATAANGTGFFFGAKVELQTGLLNPSANMARIDLRSDSKLYTEIRDEYTDRPDSTGQKVPAISRAFVASSGYVQGNRAYLKFTDKYGSVEMEGTFNASTFIGIFTYDNAMTATAGGPIAAGEVGQFQVPTCQFFRCQ